MRTIHAKSNRSLPRLAHVQIHKHCARHARAISGIIQVNLIPLSIKIAMPHQSAAPFVGERIFQNRGVCGQAFPSFLYPTPLFPPFCSRPICCCGCCCCCCYNNYHYYYYIDCSCCYNHTSYCTLRWRKWVDTTPRLNPGKNLSLLQLTQQLLFPPSKPRLNTV